MRYGRSTGSVETLWSLQVVFSPAGRLVSIQRASPGRSRSRGEMIRHIWRDIWAP
jgi:hypothetical protein